MNRKDLTDDHFPRFPRLLKGGIVLIDPETSAVRRIIVLQYNPHTLSRTLQDEGTGLVVLAALNDRIADGRDVSWIWDVDFEDLAPLPRCLVATGTRAWDMALRMKYAGVDPSLIDVQNDMKSALRAALARARPGETIYALTTYTATLDLRRLLTRMGVAPGLWKEG